MSAKDVYLKWLEENERNLANPRVALRRLEEEYENGITLAGGMLSEITDREAEFDNTLWVNVEVEDRDSKPIPKRKRMNPIALFSENQDDVEDLHEPMFEDPGWTKFTEGWLTPSRIMTAYRPHLAKYFTYVSENIDENRAIELHNEVNSYNRAFTYFTFDERSKVKVLFPEEECEQVHEIDEFQGHINTLLDLRPFINWLNRYQGKSPGIYVGYEFKVEQDARLYAALTEEATAQEIVDACRFIEIIHNDPLWRALDKAVDFTYRLDGLKSETKKWYSNDGQNGGKKYPHKWRHVGENGFIDKDKWKRELRGIAEEYLGSAEWGWSDEDIEVIHKSLKSICGAGAKWTGNEEGDDVTVIGAYLVFLMGVYDVVGDDNDLEAARTIDWSNMSPILWRSVLFSKSSGSNAQEKALKSIFKFGRDIAIRKGSSDKCTLKSKKVSRKGISVELDLQDYSKGLIDTVDDLYYVNNESATNEKPDDKEKYAKRKGQIDVAKHLKDISKSGVFKGESGEIFFELVSPKSCSVWMHFVHEKYRISSIKK